MDKEATILKQQKHTIIMVHGTFAASDTNTGNQWWQHHSKFWQSLEMLLPSNFSQIQADETFHWEGSNSATSRRTAAKNLLKIMEDYERSKRPYHLIGHSHGGSVIWDALLLSFIEKKKNKSKATPSQHLPHLQSWTTVGTPFVTQKPSGTSIMIAFFSSLSLVFTVLGGLGLATSSTNKFEASEIIIMVLVFIIPLFYLSLSFTISGLGAEQLDKERRKAWNTMRAFAGRWLGLWHIDDEAINGLRTSLKLSGKIIPRRTSLWKAFAFQKLSLLYTPLGLIINPIFNRLIAPLGDYFVWQKVKVKAAGNDRPGTNVNYISVAPIKSLSQLPPLPNKISSELTKEADNEAIRSISKIRTLLCRLGGPGEGIIEEVKNCQFSGKELIHTSYFENADIQHILAHHIVKETGMTIVVSQSNPEVVTWLTDYKATLHKLLEVEPKKTFPLVAKVLLLLSALGVCIATSIYLFKL